MSSSDTFEIRQRRQEHNDVQASSETPSVDIRRKQTWKITEEHYLMAAAFFVMIAITVLTKPAQLATKDPTVAHVWFYGWLAALSTGLGALPLLFFSKPSDCLLGMSNAIAAGMMLSASYSLISEGVALQPDGLAILGHTLPHLHRVLAGMALGIVFVVLTKRWVEQYEDLNFGDITGLEAAKILLIVSVMTVHSFAEGLGIGVSFCGRDGGHLGAFISASLAVHNVPEGLAVALVLIPRGVSGARTLLWSVCTSLPQPLIAVPVYLFVEQFVAWEPVGLGFAAGAMLWVALVELIPDALKDMPPPLAACCLSASFAGMTAISLAIDAVTA